MYQVNQVIKLDSRQFYEVSLWNMFSRKKILAILLLIVVGFGTFSMVTAIPALRVGNTNGFIMNFGIGCVMTVMAVYLAYTNIRRMKKLAQNPETLAKTEKHVKMDDDQIINYRSSVDEQIIYKWAQVEGIYDTKESYIFSMKDEQMLVFDKKKLQPDEEQFIKAKADVLGKMKSSFPIRMWIVILAVELIVMIAYGVFLAVR